ncbi:SDR family NAD(P)-dependent oxidoreductase [Pannonibacter sp. Pt2-lr]
MGVDWIADEGTAVIAAIKAAGGKAEFVPGDVSENAVCDQMVEVAVSAFGGLDGAINNAGVMDAIPPSEPIDYDRQKDLAFNPVHLASDAYWDVVMRVNATGVFRCMRRSCAIWSNRGRAARSSTSPVSRVCVASAPHRPMSPASMR